MTGFKGQDYGYVQQVRAGGQHHAGTEEPPLPFSSVSYSKAGSDGASLAPTEPSGPSLLLTPPGAALGSSVSATRIAAPAV